MACGPWIQGQPGPYLSSVEVFNPKTNQWPEEMGMAAPKTEHTASVINGKIYVMGGFVRKGKESKSKFLSMIEIYDPTTDRWAQDPDMLIGKSGHENEVIDGQIYIFRGDSLGVNGPLTSVEVYDPREVARRINSIEKL